MGLLAAGITRIPAALAALCPAILSTGSMAWASGAIVEVCADNSVLTSFKLAAGPIVSLNNFHAKARLYPSDIGAGEASWNLTEQSLPILRSCTASTASAKLPDLPKVS